MMNRVTAPSTQKPQRQLFLLPLASSDSLSTTLDDATAEEAVLDNSYSSSSGLECSARIEGYDEVVHTPRVLELKRVTGSASTHATPHRTPQTSGLVASAQLPWISQHTAAYADDVEELSDTQLQMCEADTGTNTPAVTDSIQAAHVDLSPPSRAALLQQAITLQQARCCGAHIATPSHPYSIALPQPPSPPRSSSLPLNGSAPAACATTLPYTAAQREQMIATVAGGGVPRNAQLVCRLQRKLSSVSAEQLRRYRMLCYSVRQRLYRSYYDQWQQALHGLRPGACHAGTQTQPRRAHVQMREYRGDDSSTSHSARDCTVNDTIDISTPPPSRRFQWGPLPDVAENGVAATSRPYRLLDYAAHSEAVPRKTRSASCSPTPALALPAVVPHPMRIIRV